MNFCPSGVYFTQALMPYSKRLTKCSKYSFFGGPISRSTMLKNSSSEIVSTLRRLLFAFFVGVIGELHILHVVHVRPCTLGDEPSAGQRIIRTPHDVHAARESLH